MMAESEIRTFDWRHLNGKTLRIAVVQSPSHMGDPSVVTVAGIDEQTREVYILHQTVGDGQ